MAITVRDFYELKEEVLEKIRNLEISQRLLKMIVIYNAITNTVIALLLWQLINVISVAFGHGANQQQGVLQGQQIAVVNPKGAG